MLPDKRIPSWQPIVFFLAMAWGVVLLTFTVFKAIQVALYVWSVTR